MWLRHDLICRFLFNLAVLNCSGVSVGMDAMVLLAIRRFYDSDATARIFNYLRISYGAIWR
jgi:hypothetical protein